MTSSTNPEVGSKQDHSAFDTSIDPSRVYDTGIAHMQNKIWPTSGSCLVRIVEVIFIL